MYHRLCNFNGLGNPSDCILDNNIKIDKEKWNCFCDDFCNTYKLINDYEGFDFHYDEQSFIVGIEPTYMYDELLIIKFDLNNKNNSSITTGIAWGEYGTRWCAKTSAYGKYKRKSKFTAFIDKWYDFVKKTLQGADK